MMVVVRRTAAESDDGRQEQQQDGNGPVFEGVRFQKRVCEWLLENGLGSPFYVGAGRASAVERTSKSVPRPLHDRPIVKDERLHGWISFGCGGVATGPNGWPIIRSISASAFSWSASAR